jgi:6-pyruvoyltetrahydropterin/6-carboxytetrahydropterin synthase
MKKLFTLTKKFTFEAAHDLPRHDGKCRRLHGHSWVMVVAVAGDRLRETGPKSGMLMDYGDMSLVVKPLVEAKLDHHYLNDTTSLDNPTSEELARWIYEQLKPLLPLLLWVEIQETCTSSCRYQPLPARRGK